MRRMKHVFIFLFALGMLAYAEAQPAKADLIMLTGDGWTFNPSQTNAYKNITVGVETLRVDVESYYTSTHSLTHNTSLGFGVNSAAGGSTLLDPYEIVIVSFSRAVTISGYTMSDWSTGIGFEPKLYRYDGSELYLPTTGTVDGSGLMSVSFTGLPMAIGDRLFFRVLNTNDPLGLARLDVTVNAVPVPGAVWLLGTGLIGLAAIRRRFRR